MYCMKCGTQIPKGSKFCESCGAVQQVEQQSLRKEKKKSKGSKIAITCVIVLCAWIIGRIAGGSMADSYNKDKQINKDYESTSDNKNEPDEASVNPEYTEIFTSHYIVESPSFILGMDRACFAIEVENGCIQKMEFGYEEDVVLTMIQKLYIPLENYSSIDDIKNLYQEVEQAECCEVEFETGNLFYTVTITCEDMDDADNLAELYQLEMVSDAAGHVSMKETEAGLLADGYVKR